MNTKLLMLIGICALGTSCSKPPTASTDGKPKYNLSLDMKEMMGHVVDPGAWAFWKATGTEETAKGTRSLSPTTE
ncbi:hypothetical protein ABTO94_20245, partial [Acinetobacter baumannii]